MGSKALLTRLTLTSLMESVSETAEIAALPTRDTMTESAIPMKDVSNCSIITGINNFQRALLSKRSVSLFTCDLSYRLIAFMLLGLQFFLCFENATGRISSYSSLLLMISRPSSAAVLTITSAPSAHHPHRNPPGASS